MRAKKNYISLFLLLFASTIFFPDIVFADEESKYQLQSKKIQYIDKNNTIIAEGDAEGKDQYGKKIFSDKIIYYKSKSQIQTFKNSKYKDLKGNTIFADNFFYDLKLWRERLRRCRRPLPEWQPAPPSLVAPSLLSASRRLMSGRT